MEKALGCHLIVDYFKCPLKLLNDISRIERFMKDAVVHAGATIVSSSFKRFEPFGVSGIVIIAESHLSIHTWPEYGYAAVDLFTCGQTVNPWKAHEYLQEKLGTTVFKARELKRGEFSVGNTDFSHKCQPGEPLKTKADLDPILQETDNGTVVVRDTQANKTFL
jgi:S-adenosylmethionine decarboxylase